MWGMLRVSLRAAGTAVMTFTKVVVLPTMFQDQGTFSPSQMAQLKNGEYYVNVHTSAYEDGEIRGALVPD